MHQVTKIWSSYLYSWRHKTWAQFLWTQYEKK